MRHHDSSLPRPSRTAVKQAALAVTELAHKIADLPEAAFRRLLLDEATREDFRIARNLKPSGARDRQLRHLSALLRDDENLLEQLRATLDGVDQQHLDESRRFHELEELRDRLLDPHRQAAALDDITRRFPALDRPTLERALKQHRTSSDKAAFRTVFRLLRAAAEQTPAASDGL